ncbi:MAG: HAMP domain-containing protein [Acidobacteria bacterium]|nr:HAMP domain-containing protein [Acidobacteriota bacterium]MCW5949224.1 HAMP domain-containing protein [Pyrinomonadaceae bacterium]
MKDSKQPSKPRKVPWVLGTIVLAIFVLLVMLQGSNVWKNFTVETASDTVLLYALSTLNVFALIVFGFILLRSILKLARERKALTLGAKIKTRLLLYFAIVSILPIVAMAVFSYLLMNRAIDRWFTQIPENAIREARNYQQGSIEERLAAIDRSAALIAAGIGSSAVSDTDLYKYVSAGGLEYVEVRSSNNVKIASAFSLRSDALVEFILSLDSGSTIPLSARDGTGYNVGIAKLPDGRSVIVVPSPYSETTVSQIVDNSLAEFDNLKARQATVRQVGFLTLGVLTFVLIFASSWLAFYAARGLTTPIQALAGGAREISSGNFGHRVDVIAEDELALLVDAFNEMSATLESNSAELLERRRYIETVVATLPNGVVSFDADGKVGTINRAAVNILRLEEGDLTGLGLDAIVSENDRAVIERLLARAGRAGRASEHISLSRHGADGREIQGELPVALTAAALPDGGGVVLVIEDLSELIAAQRASAWQEVARRMAHEIKNPLTPIQLSAERIAKKCVPSDGSNGIHATDPAVGPESIQVVRDGTETILREVASLKSMVDEFSRFARLPDTRLEPGDLNEAIELAVSGFTGRPSMPHIEMDLSADLPAIQLDREQLKRVFVNLIENAVEAFDQDAADPRINIATRYDTARDIVIAEVSDNGKGIHPGDLRRLFQPYFSTKGRGTGLGLAIVHRIIAEHNGRINAVGETPRGARFIIEIPVSNT